MTAVPGVETLIPVRVRDFTNVVAMQGTLTVATGLTPAIVTVEQPSTSVPGLTLANFVTAPGTVSFVWASATSTPLTLPANTVLFVLRVLADPTGVAGSRRVIRWTSAPVPVEMVQAPAILAPPDTRNGFLLIAPRVSVSGTVRTSTGVNVPGLTLTFAQENSPVPAVATLSNVSGLFTFSGFATGAYTLTPTKTNDVTVTNGVTVSDIVLLQRHILGTQLLSSAPKFLAGDVNRDAVLTVADVALVQEFILGRTTSFPGGLLWRFYPTGLGLTATSPGNPAPSRSYQSLTAATAQDFTACKFGDVNDTWNPAIPRPATDGAAVALVFRVPTAPVAPGARVRVPLTLAAAAHLAGLQGTVAWDPAALRLVSATPALPGLLTATPDDGQLAFLWTDLAGQPRGLPATAPLLWLDFEVTGAPGTLTPLALLAGATPALALDAALDAHPLNTGPAALLVGGGALGVEEPAGASAPGVWPNPAHATVRVAGTRPAGPVVLLDALGRAVLTVTADHAGTATFDLRGLMPGVYGVRGGGRAGRLVVE